jgi:hypothetical protein
LALPLRFLARLASCLCLRSYSLAFWFWLLIALGDGSGSQAVDQIFHAQIFLAFRWGMPRPPWELGYPDYCGRGCCVRLRRFSNFFQRRFPTGKLNVNRGRGVFQKKRIIPVCVMRGLVPHNVRLYEH